MHIVRNLMLIALAAALSACTTVRSRVSTFHKFDGRPLPSFAIIAYQEQVNSLEFQTYATVVRENLIERGFKEAPADRADVAVFFDYRIDDGRQVAYSYPLWGQTGTQSTYTAGSAYSIGNSTYIQGTTRSIPRYGVVGAGVASATLYRRVLRLDMIDREASLRQSRAEKVYEATVVSEGTTEDLPTVMPFLLKALFEQFPAASGSVRTVNIPMR